MTEGVVDDLEAIEVEGHDGKLALGSLRLRYGELQPIAEQSAIGQMRKRIVPGLEINGFLRCLRSAMSEGDWVPTLRRASPSPA